MKRIIAAALTLTLSLSMGTAVYADSSKLNPDPKEIKVTYQTGTVKNDAVYSVDVEWGDLAYTYSSGGVKTWNPTELKYEIKNSSTPTWSCAEGADKIKVTNNSNVGITAKLSYSKEQASVDGTFDQTKINLNSAEGTEAGEGPSGMATLSLTGEMNENDPSASELGKVEITVGEFEGETIYDRSIIISNNLNFKTTGKDGVYTVSGTISGTEKIDLTGLKIGGVTHKIGTGNSTIIMYTDNSKVFEVDLSEGATNNNAFRLWPETGTYNYVLTINTNTKKVTVVLSE